MRAPAQASVLVLTLSHVPASQHSLWLSQSAKAEEQAAASSVDVTGINAKYDGVNFCLNAKNSKMMTTDEKPPSVFKSFQTLQVTRLVTVSCRCQAYYNHATLHDAVHCSEGTPSERRGWGLRDA